MSFGCMLGVLLVSFWGLLDVWLVCLLGRLTLSFLFGRCMRAEVRGDLGFL